MKSLITALITLCLLLLSGITSALPTDLNITALIERQAGCSSVPCSVVVGDGNPHQWIMHKQLSPFVDCGDSEQCYVHYEDEKSYTVSADTYGAEFTTGGLAVSESVDTGVFDNPCLGGRGQKVCAMAEIWFTDYTVKTGVYRPCDNGGCDGGDETTIIRAPNNFHAGIVHYLCGLDDDCGDQGQETWFGGPAIPPPAPAALEERDSCKTDSKAGCGSTLVGNGDPNQWILHKQISNRVLCAEGPCYVLPKGETAYKVSWHHDGTDNVDWIDGGFEVTTDVSTGVLLGDTDYNCQGLPHETVCIFADLWYTSYTVQGSASGGCNGDCEQLSPTTVITSPNKIKDHVNHVCKHNDECGQSGDGTWIDARVSGGPPALEGHVERQCGTGPGPCSLEGNGSPKQKILHKQISNPVLCADGPCYVLPEGEQSYTVNFQKSPADDIVWIDGGFDVAKSVDTGILEGDALTGCTSLPHETVCIFADIWHTQYTVRGFDYVRCDQVGGGEPADHTTILTSPNKITNGVTYRCAHDDQCGNSGDESWTDDLLGTIGSPPAAAALAKRKVPHLDGDGFPHQWILHHQISDSVTCTGFADDPICTISTKQETDTELHAIPTDKPWIEGGFAVTKSLHTGIMDEEELNFCVAKPGHTVCIFADLWYTKYTAREGDADDFCIGEECLWIITSPNIIKDQVNLICAHDDQCHGKWYEEWWDAHVPGGPP